MSGYTDTHILEANRVQSRQFDDENETSIWTNTLSDGIKLNVGDKVSLSSAFISDLGAEDSTIEFKGKIIQSQQKFIVSKVTDTLPDTPDFTTTLKTTPRPNIVRQTINASEVVLNNIRDNEANIVLSYYKTNNGEYMMNLPFYAHPISSSAVSANDAWAKARTNSTHVKIIESGDASSHLPLKASASHILGSDMVVDPLNLYQGLIMDNSRYMIFGQPNTEINFDNELTTDFNNISKRDLNGYHNYYIRIRDLLQLKVPIGFNSPSEVSNVITQQLTENTKIEQKTINYYSASTTSVLNHSFGPVNETKTNKLFNAATVNSTVIETAFAYYGGPRSANVKPNASGQEIRDYNQSFQYIGIKRPEIYESGIKLKISVNTQLSDGEIDLDLLEHPPLRTIASDVDLYNWLRVPRGSLQNQIPLYPGDGGPSANPTIRFPDWTTKSAAVDDSFMRDNLNPYFTDFLQENPFRLWNESASLTKETKTYKTVGATTGNFYRFNLEITGVLPLLEINDYDIITATCSTHPFTPTTTVTITSVTQISASEQQIEINGLTAAAGIPDGTNITIVINANQAYLPTPYTVINTGMRWTEENLNNLKSFFDEQKRYPELFDMNGTNNHLAYRTNVGDYQEVYNGEEVTIDTHRYLHLQSKLNGEMPKELGVESDGEIEPVMEDVQANERAVLTSFGYDNIPSVFSEHGTTYGTVNTKDIDFSSMPLFVKYFPEFASNGSGLTTEQFENEVVWDNGKNVPYRPVSASLVKGDNLWGGFAIKSKSSVAVVPKVNDGEFRNYANITDNTDMEVIKSYNPEQEVFKRVFGAGFADDDDGGIKEFDYETSVYDTISFIAQVPLTYLEKKPIYTRIDANGVYDPTAVPVQRQIPTLYTIDYWAEWLNKSIGTKEAATQRIMTTDTRRIGYDNHPNAYGNACIGLMNGLAGTGGFSYRKEYYTAINSEPRLDQRGATEVVHQPVSLYADKYLNEVYCGAQEPEFSFDTVSSRFAISNLHTPERITAKYNATWQVKGGDPSASKQSSVTSVPIPDNLGKSIYKINKIFDFRNFCPSITPYFQAVPEKIDGTEEEFPVVFNNPYCKAGEIFDMASGIFLEDFNIEKNNWNNSFWGICGFSYNDLNIQNTGNINARITTGKYNNIARLTTNQDVVNSGIGEWDGKVTGVANYKNQYTYPSIITYKKDAGGTNDLETFAPVEVESDSAQIEATNLPTKTLRPYFTVRSDILTDSYFNGGHKEPSLMPVIAVLQKNQQYGDFFYGNGDIDFTVTYPRTITEVTTQICDPTGRPSKLSPNSAVMYKVVKAKTQNNIVQDVLQANKGNPNIQQELFG